MKKLVCLAFVIFTGLPLFAQQKNIILSEVNTTIAQQNDISLAESDTTKSQVNFLYARLFVEYASQWEFQMVKQKDFQPKTIKFIDENGNSELLHTHSEPEALNLLKARGYSVLNSNITNYKLETELIVLCSYLLCK